jgi:N-acetyl-alpha-D-glucosaminyl L-malate synthase BshA
MNIAIVCYPTFGGSGVLATELGKALAQKGHSIHFITYQQPVRLSGFYTNIYYHEVHVPAYPLFDFAPYETALASTLVDVAIKNKIDLVHAHYAIPHASAAYMAKKILARQGYSLPVITTLHGTDITLVGKDKTYRPVVTFSMLESDRLTAVSKNLKEETYKNFDIDKPIDVIYNFVDFQRFNRKPVLAFKQMLAPQGEKIIAHSSNFRKLKRVQDVVAVFAKLRQRMPVKLLLIGDGPERPSIEMLANTLDLSADVRFLGKQEQIEDILPLADLFLLPSEYESFGLAALEAMAAELPVISSDAGGLPEINIHESTGYLCPVGDISQMADCSYELLTNETMHAAYRKQALEQAKRFSIDTIVPQYEELYRSVLTDLG